MLWQGCRIQGDVVLLALDWSIEIFDVTEGGGMAETL
jgi:hypothetical protein